MKVHDIVKESRKNLDMANKAEELVGIVLSKNIARELLLVYAKQIDEELYKDCLLALKRLEDAGNYAVEKAMRTKSLRQKIEVLNLAKDLYASSKSVFYEKVTARELLLLEQQKILARATGDRSLPGCSISGTLYKLIIEDEHAQLKKFIKELKIKDKILWMVRLRVKTDTKDWLGVEALLKLKKNPPIGFKPFIKVFLQNGLIQTAEGLIIKVKETDYQLEMLEHTGNYLKAAEIAFKNKLYDVLPELVKKSNSIEVSEYVNNALASIKK